MNLNKTNFMVFTNKNINNNDIVVKVKETRVTHVTHQKFLGVTIDEKMSWNIHVNNVCKSKNIIYRS